jgi:hypothetical protein
MGHVMVFLFQILEVNELATLWALLGAIGYFVCHVIEVDSNFNILLMFCKIGCLVFKCN